jgi:hypothetical protein
MVGLLRTNRVYGFNVIYSEGEVRDSVEAQRTYPNISEQYVELRKYFD